MSTTNFLSDEASLADIISRMSSPDREIFDTYKSLKVEAAFLDRIFVVYKPCGLQEGPRAAHRDPEVLTQIRVTDFRVDCKTGAEVDLEDLTTREVMTCGFIPKRLFNYDVFCGVAPRQRMNWDASIVNGILRRTLSFGLLLKVRSRAEFFSMGATAFETPNNFRALFPSAKLQLNNKS